LNSEIKNLEEKSNKTPEEDKELENKRKELENLNDKDDNNKPKNNSPHSSTNSNSFDYKPWLVGGGCLIVFLIVIFILFRKKGRR